MCRRRLTVLTCQSEGGERFSVPSVIMLVGPRSSALVSQGQNPWNLHQCLLKRTCPSPTLVG